MGSFGIKHPVDAKNGYSHTVLNITVDKEGHFWLSTICAKSGCTGHVMVEVLPAQVERWRQLGIGESKDHARQQTAA